MESLDVFMEGITSKQWMQLGTHQQRNKPREHILGLAEAILSIDADILCLYEVGGQHSLDLFNAWGLNSRYRAFYLEGNSDRGIGIGVLLKATSPWKIHLESNHHMDLELKLPHDIESEKMNLKVKTYRPARDLPEVFVFDDSDRLMFVILPCHLKSKRDPYGLDPDSREQRQAELQALCKIAKRHLGRTPLLVCGDFNSSVSRNNPELSPLFELGLRELMEWLDLPERERWSFFSRSSPFPLTGMALDTFFFSEEWSPLILKDQSSVFAYRPNGALSFPPKSKSAFQKIPSDHCPIVMAFHGLPSL